MENKKTLRVSCALCDTLGITEELLSTYEKIYISCANLITSPRIQVLMGKYGVEIGTASVISVPVDEKISKAMFNGHMEITPNQAPPDKNTVLVVNGILDIAPGSEKIVERYAHIIINGTLRCPEGMFGQLNNVSFNGKIKTYPDGCIRLKPTAVLDRTFHLRAKQDSLYYADKRIVAVDENIRFDALTAKNVRFSTPGLLVCESLAEAAVPLVDEQADIIVVPDGCAYVNDDAVLDGTLLKRYGSKLFIDGDLTLNADSAPWVEKLEYLRVNGDVLAVRAMKDQAAALNAVYDGLSIIAGTRIEDKSTLTVTRGLLEAAKDGLDIADCAKVTFQEDVSPELIQDKLLHLSDCAAVTCTPEQMPVLELLASDVTHLGTAEKEPEDEEAGDENMVCVSSAVYTF